MVDGLGLWPPPRITGRIESPFEIPKVTHLKVTHSAAYAGIAKLESTWRECCLGQLSKDPKHFNSASGRVQLQMGENRAAHPEGYRIRIDDQGILVQASGEAGLFFGTMTLCQWLVLNRHHHQVPLTQVSGLEVEDWPDFQNRGLMIDISRNKVPSMAELFETIDLAAYFKLNQVQLYMEHTFAYRGHEQVWRDASPMTGEEIQALDHYCKARHIELVANQNSFGHFHQWLKHEQYRDLAECPDGIEHPFSLDKEPFSLCPTDPRTMALLSDLYEQLLPHFSSGQFNVGLDETFDLGEGRSAEICKVKGKTEVYLKFLNQVHQLIGKHGRRMQFWGDIIIQKPESLAQLPQDAIALEWGYEADHPFQEHAQQFANSGREFYVCPGTSSWSSVVGRVDNAIANLASAARAGHRFGASGYLITDWGDYGHLQPPAICWPGWLAGAGWSWHVESIETNHTQALIQAMSHHLFHTPDPTAAQALWEMGCAYRDCDIQPSNGSSLFFLLLYADQTMTHARLNGLTAAGLERSRTRLKHAAQILAQAPMNRVDSDWIRMELDWALNLTLFACDLGTSWLNAGPDQPLGAIAPKAKTALKQRLDQLIQQLPNVRATRFREGGLPASQRYLLRVAALLA